MTSRFEPLIEWFQERSRALPWRENRTPYSVFVSEVMLQQTQAITVIPYFLTWMQKYPTVLKLAEANEEEVLKTWEGLGYYSRARRLLEAARLIRDQFGGEFPEDSEKLALIPGMGPYTHAAVLAFAFQKKKIAVDGNVARVLTRVWGHGGDLKSQAVWKELRARGDKELPEKMPWVVSEALIELGALVCKKEPDCLQCPLKSGCTAYREGTQKTLPFNSAKIAYENLERLVFVMTKKDQLFLTTPKSGVMQGLFEFPYMDIGSSEGDLQSMVEGHLQKWGCVSESISPFPIVRHSFTRFRAKLFPFHIRLDEKSDNPPFSGFSSEVIEKLTFSSGHRRVLHHFFKEGLSKKNVAIEV